MCPHNKIIQLCRICDGSDLCISGFCDTIKNEKYENYCLRCFIYLFPNKPNTRNYKTKEKSVVDFVTQQFLNFSWISDKKVTDGCSRRRPDLFLDLGFQIIKSCWKANNSNGIILVQQNKLKEWNERLEILKNQIEYWCNEENKTEKTIEIIQLFFDDN